MDDPPGRINAGAPRDGANDARKKGRVPKDAARMIERWAKVRFAPYSVASRGDFQSELAFQSSWKA